MEWTNTNDALKSIRGVVVKSLRDELREQNHINTGRLSRSIKGGKMFNIRGGKAINIISSVAYWKAVNNPKFAKKPNFLAIKKWAKQRGLPDRAVMPIFKRILKEGYGNKDYPNNNMRNPYRVYTEGNKLKRTNFAGYAANKVKKKVREGVQEGVAKDVTKMIKASFREELGTKNVRFIK